MSGLARICRSSFVVCLPPLLSHSARCFPRPRAFFSHASRSLTATQIPSPEESTMKKTAKITSLLLFTGALTLGASYVQKKEEPKPIVFTRVEGRAWAEACLKKYPEISWLADSDVKKTEEGRALEESPYSEQIYGKKFIEFDRTIMGLHCLKLFLQGDKQAYEELTKDQPQDKRLAWESFKEIHEMGLSLIDSKHKGLSCNQMAQTLETALILADMGKSPKARAKFESYGATAPDHDDFYGQAVVAMLKNPELSPSFNRLPITAQELLAEVAALIHYGHVTHCEGGAEMFARIKKSAIASRNPLAMRFDSFVHLCDVAGAAGHVNKKSSVMCTQDTYRALKATYDACLILSDSTKEEFDAYKAYVAVRASWLSFNPQDPTDFMLTRFGSMLRLFTPQEGESLKKAFFKLDEQQRAHVLKEFGMQKYERRTPTYMPAVLLNLYNFDPKASLDAKMELAVTALPFLANVLQSQKPGAQAPLNFNKVAGAVKEDPDLVKYGDFEIDATTQEVLLHPVRA